MSSPGLTVGIISDELSPPLHQTLASLDPISPDCEILIQVAKATQSEVDSFLAAFNGTDIIRVLPPGDSGIYNGMNRIRIAARGNYLWYLNAGDQMHVDMDLKTLIDLLSEETCYGFRSLQLYHRDRYLRPSAADTNPDPVRIGHQSSVYCKRAYEAVSFDESLPVSADVSFNLTCFAQYGLNFQPQVLSRFTLGGLSNRYLLRDFSAYRGENPGLRLKFLVKVILRKVIGQRLLYRVLALGKYDHSTDDQ